MPTEAEAKVGTTMDPSTPDDAGANTANTEHGPDGVNPENAGPDGTCPEDSTSGNHQLGGIQPLDQPSESANLETAEPHATTPSDPEAPASSPPSAPAPVPTTPPETPQPRDPLLDKPLPRIYWFLTGGTGPPPTMRNFLRMTSQRRAATREVEARALARRQALEERRAYLARWDGEWGSGCGNRSKKRKS
ncbi:hypothetical protein F5Y11DRAFT_366514 [Daldinia sp. FL1419]|nr:hypothetical protein F5Y11DRAFT_366514 [Daldinia sp. FL1419]